MAGFTDLNPLISTPAERATEQRIAALPIDWTRSRSCGYGDVSSSKAEIDRGSDALVRQWSMDLFEPCWHRIDRADEHRRSMLEVWNNYLDGHPYDFELFHEGDGVHILRVWEDSPMPPEFAIRLGEWLYNLRSCLDYIVWATAAYMTGIVPAPDEATLQYPIYETKSAWDRNAYRLKHLGEHHRNMLWTMQPFNSDMDANFLGALNNLARIDRHRRPTEGTAYLAELEPVAEVPADTSIVFQWGQRVLSEGKADTARLAVEPWRDDMKVSINPRIGIDPEVGEWAKSPFWRRIRFGERLAMIQVFVAAEVAVYEYDCTGETRQVEALTDTYRTECDARKRNGPPRRVVDSWEWSPPVKGRPSTAERYRGDGSPPDGAQPVPGR
jgi:hypothetical protein